jgi:hypothetical protein
MAKPGEMITSSDLTLRRGKSVWDGHPGYIVSVNGGPADLLFRLTEAAALEDGVAYVNRHWMLTEEGWTPRKTPLHTFTNAGEGMESYVWPASRGGYNVTMRDLDSGEFVPEARWTDDEENAIATAKKWANVPQ